MKAWKKLAVINYWYFLLKIDIMSYRLQGVKLGLKSVMFLCRMYLGMYFSLKRFFVWSAEFFSVLTHEFNMLFVRHGGTKTHMAVIQRLCISIGKELFIKTYKCFWYKPSHSSLLIGCYNAIYVTLDKIQTRTLAHPCKPNHYV